MPYKITSAVDGVSCFPLRFAAIFREKNETSKRTGSAIVRPSSTDCGGKKIVVRDMVLFLFGAVGLVVEANLVA